MVDVVDAATEIARLFRKWGSERKVRGEEKAAAGHLGRAGAIEDLIREVRELRRWKLPVPSSYGDISDLPDELVSQLSGVKTDELEEQIYSIVKAAGAEIELDRLLIELYRRFGEVQERRFLNNKCYRMVQKGLIHQVPGRKGVYTASEPESQDALDALLGESQNPNHPNKDFRADLDDEIPF